MESLASPSSEDRIVDPTCRVDVMQQSIDLARGIDLVRIESRHLVGSEIRRILVVSIDGIQSKRSIRNTLDGSRSNEESSRVDTEETSSNCQ